jgi:hypothetical protein
MIAMNTTKEIDPAHCPEQRDMRGPFITTYSGAKFFIDQYNIQDIPIEDIAHALSMNCRFNGHLSEYYSVAEHSIVVSHLVDRDCALEGLLHDITEAFIPDMPRPFKTLITGFEEYEKNLWWAAADHFGLSPNLPENVKYIDKNIVRDEAQRFYSSPPDWINFYESVCPQAVLIGMSPSIAKMEFLARFKELTYGW